MDHEAHTRKAYYGSMNNNLVIYAIPSELMPLYVLVCGAVVTKWFLSGLLNPFIDAALVIIKCAIESTLAVFFWPINTINKRVDKYIRLPIQKFIRSIPEWIKTCIYLLLGIYIFFLDQKYGTKIFNLDETTPFVQIHVWEKPYWVSFYAIVGCGWFFLLVGLRILGVIFNWIGKLLDKNIKLDILIYR